MSAFDYNSLKEHIGHEIECVPYGEPDDPVNVAVECVTCGCVLLDYDKPEEETNGKPEQTDEKEPGKEDTKLL